MACRGVRWGFKKLIGILEGRRGGGRVQAVAGLGSSLLEPWKDAFSCSPHAPLHVHTGRPEYVHGQRCTTRRFRRSNPYSQSIIPAGIYRLYLTHSSGGLRQ